MMKKEDTIQMSVGGLTLDPVTKTPIVILKDTENKLNLPGNALLARLCLAAAASRLAAGARGGASKTVRSQAEPGNEWRVSNCVRCLRSCDLKLTAHDDSFSV